MTQLARRSGAVILSALALVMGSGAAVWAHGDPPDIAFYGNYSSGTARCQRALGAAVRTCFDTALAEHTRCMEAQMAGDMCDTTARDLAIEDAKQAARLLVAESCSTIQLNILQFLSLSEAQTDVANGCGSQIDTTLSLLYGPVTGGNAAGTPAEGREACVQTTAYQATKILKRALRTRERSLDRIAAKKLGVSVKREALAQVSQRLMHARQLVTRRIEAACGTDMFSAVYGQSIDSFLDVVEARANCLIGATYVQNAVVCPEPVCGNGAKEAGEECDDGNQVDDDACRNNCTRSILAAPGGG